MKMLISYLISCTEGQEGDFTWEKYYYVLKFQKRLAVNMVTMHIQINYEYSILM